MLLRELATREAQADPVVQLWVAYRLAQGDECDSSSLAIQSLLGMVIYGMLAISPATWMAIVLCCLSSPSATETVSYCQRSLPLEVQV